MAISILPYPAYFGVGAGIEYFSVIVALIISFFAYRVYVGTKDGKYGFFALSFVFIALNLAAHATQNLFQYREVLDSFIASLTPASLSLVALVYYAFIVSILFAYMFFVQVYAKIVNKEAKLLLYIITLFLGVLTLYNNLLLFQAAAALFALFVFYYTYKNYMRKKSTPTLLVTSGFFGLFLYHLLFAIQFFTSAVFNIKYIPLLLGFIAILIVFIKASTHGRKKK